MTAPGFAPLMALWVGFMALATYGSIYPFDFQYRPLDRDALAELMHGSWTYFSRGNALGNVLLFAPLGFFGALLGRSRPMAWTWLAVVCGVSLVLATALQVVQLYLPGRVPNLQDVAWNMLGVAGGIAAAVLWRDTVRRLAAAGHRFQLAPLVLTGVWLVYRLIPFVPSLSFQNIKDSLKPLLLSPEITTLGIAGHICAWLVVAQLLRLASPGRALDRYLALLILVTFGLEVLMVNNAVSADNVLGAGIAVVVWWLVIGRLRNPAGVVAAILIAVIVASGLAPFTLRGPPQAFHWLPFQGFLGGSMYINAQVACHKTFLYGSLVLLLWQARLGRMVAPSLAVGAVGAVEIAQIWLPGRTPEITDPLLVVLAAVALWALQPSEPGRPGHRPKPARVD